MAEEAKYTSETKIQTPGDVEASDRGLFDFAKKDKLYDEDDAISSEFHAKVKVDSDEKKEGFLEKLHRSHSSSSSSSDEEQVDENGEKTKKKKKKGLKEKIEEKINKEDDDEDTHVPVEKPGPECHPEEKKADPDHGKEKKGFLEKIKEKIPGYHPKSPEDKEKAKDGGNY